MKNRTPVGETSVKIRKELMFRGVRTIPELSREIGVTFPTIRKNLEQLIDRGVVVELDTEESSGGRPAKRYIQAADYGHGLSLYVERDVIRYRVLDLARRTLEEDAVPLKTASHLTELIDLIASLTDRDYSIMAIAVGVAGSVDQGRIFFAPDFPSLQNIQLKQQLEKRFAVPAVIENDMNAAVIGYARSDIRRLNQSLVYLYLGKNGPGAGLLLGGRLIRGSTSFSGEVSFVPLYDEQNFRDALRDKPDGLDAIARLTAMFAATLNPHALIFSDVEISDGQLREIEESCANYIPKEHLPRLILSSWEQDYLNGLDYLCLNLAAEQPIS
ncbi:ROK family transcriptional regulator [Exiguobacterium flavidum]|uniref:ROK family transcriptional regulator n=1 Tax=Exiguobacterium flavidum TaxID=2184695 RepID=UPI001E434793|nr:ROK family transcriptional regulator [Exiguobacterium flavidum]